MVDTTAAYLNDLARAARDLPRDVAESMVSGVREELTGLSDSAARERMGELGDPEFIAASARAELPLAAPTAESSRYSLVTVLLLAFGGVVVPLVGWVAGVVLLMASRVWTRRDKLIGALAAPTVAILGVIVCVVVGTGIPFNGGGFSALASGVIVAIPIAPLITTPYLLLRARRLRARSQP